MDRKILELELQRVAASILVAGGFVGFALMEIAKTDALTGIVGIAGYFSFMVLIILWKRS